MMKEKQEIEELYNLYTATLTNAFITIYKTDSKFLNYK